MRGIFPDYIGPTVEYRHASRFPRWVGVLSGLVPSIPEGWLGGVEVLPNTYAAAIVASTIDGITSLVKTAAISVAYRFGVIEQEKPGAEVTDEEAGV